MPMRSAITHPAPIKDREFLERLDQLAKESLHVRARADEIVERVLGLSNAFQTAFFDDLRGRDLYAVACGDREIYEGHDLQKELREFWNAVHALVATQFSGFSLAGGEATKAVLWSWNAATSDSRNRRLFWSFTKYRSNSLPDCLFARAFALLSLFSIVLPRVSRPNEDEIKRAIQQLSDKIVSKLVRDNGENRSGRRWLLWHVRLLKLVQNLAPETLNEHEATSDLRGLERRLRDDLAISLQHANVDTPEFEVAEMVGVLGGRHLNPGVQIEPGDSALYSQAVQYVLKRRHPRKGTWDVQDGMPDELGK